MKIRPRSLLRRMTLAPVLAIWLASGVAAAADAPDAATIAAARRLLDVTAVAEQAETLMDRQIAYVMGVMQQRNPDTPGRVFDILEEEFAAIGPTAVAEIVDYTVTLYAERLTAEEMNALADFYETELGRKALSVLPELMSDGAARGQEIGQRLGQQAAAKALARIRAEGLDRPAKAQ